MAIDANLISALGAGSGVDIKALAKGLTDAERVPKQNAIQSKIDKTEAKISGYSAMMAVLNTFKASVDTIDSTTDFAGLSVRNSNPAAFSVSTNGAAVPASHTIEVNTLARAQRSYTNQGFENITSPLNGGDAFALSITVGPAGSQTTTTVNIAQGDTGLSAVANAINLSGAGISAQVLDSGEVGAADRYRLVLAGQPGAAKEFSLSSTGTDPLELQLTTAADQTATDASLTVNGLLVTRATNSINDLIPGVTLDLSAPTTQPATLALARDPTGVKDKVRNLVQAYNDMVSDFGILSGKKSDDPEDVFSGSLAGDSAVRTVLSQIRQVLFSESETKGTDVANLRNLGVSVDRNGVLSLNETELDAAVSQNYDQVVQALSGRQSVVENGQTVTKRGLGVAMSAKLTQIMGPSGAIMTQSSSAETQVLRYKKDLEALEDRMDRILERYTRQFAAMESLVGQLSAMRENLKGQFEGLAEAYKK
jgi:flagellar hook-associated protein 2